MWRCKKCGRIEGSPRRHYYRGSKCDGEWEEGERVWVSKKET